MPRVNRPSWDMVEALIDAKREANISCDIDMRSYSGRAMYGDRCIAIVGIHSECMTAIADTISAETQRLFNNMEEEAPDLVKHNFLVKNLLNFRQDSMGRDDVVVYWPDTRLTESQEKALVDNEDEDE